MDKNNTKLLFCLLGGTFLVLLKSPVFESAKFALYEGTSGYGGHKLGESLFHISNILSFIWFILVVMFLIWLIVRNLNFKNRGVAKLERKMR